MIKLKARPDVPPILTSDEVLDFAEELKRRVVSGEDLKSTDFEGRYWRNPEVKKALFEMHYNGKCCYCERRRDEKRELDVEHFRPKAEVITVPTHPGYWWLAYKWDNYFYSCKRCNEDYKGSLFPLLDETLRVYDENGDMSSESPYLINPELEDPEEYIDWDWYTAYKVFVKATSKDPDGRGKEAIKMVGLNEDDLPGERAELVGDLKLIAETMTIARHSGNQPIIDEMAGQIRFHTQGERIFAGFRRAFFRAQGFDEYVANN